MFTEKPTDKSKYILLRNTRAIIAGVGFSSFFTIYDKKDENPTKLATGEVAYEIIGYTETMAEAQKKLHGRVTTTRDD